MRREARAPALEAIVSRLRREDGPHTRDLVREPGAFGLGQVPSRLAPDRTTTVVCGFCSTGCGLDVHLKDGEAVNLTPSTRYPVNRGMACPKGWEALAPLTSPDRATTPLLRGDDGRTRPVSWDTAMTEFTRRFRAVLERHGGDAMAFLSTGQIPTEEMLALGVVARVGMGMRHGDGNTRQCMATAVTAYKESFGFDAPPYTYADFEESDVIVLVGSNLCIAHPIQWERICRNPHSPEIVVVDPRRTETAVAATQHYPIAPKSDLYFFYAVAHVLIERGFVDRRYIREHTRDFDAFAEHVRAFSPDAVADRVGLPAEDIVRLAETIHAGKRVSFWWTMGVNQGHEAVRTAQALIDLALMTGNMGRPGTGANSITGQCNAMGSRLFSCTTSLPGCRDFTDPVHRDEVASALGLAPSRIPDTPSLAYDEIIDAIHQGRIRGLWIVATNTAHSWIHQTSFHEAAAKLDFLVVQDMYHDTETAQLADLVLPAAGWGEKDGTFINSERRYGLVKKVRRAPGQALADFHIIRLAAEYWGVAELFERWKTPEDVFDSIRELSRGRPCDISGIRGYRTLDEHGGLQWPLVDAADAQATERRLFEDGRYYHPDGRARFVFDPPSEVPEPTDADYPLVLLTGRGSSSQWHTQTRTARSSVLRALHRNVPYVEISTEDAAAASIEPFDVVRVVSRRGAMEAEAVVTPTLRAGQVFVAMHWADTNLLTHPTFDPHSHQPSYKHCAVRIEAMDGTDPMKERS